MECLFFHAEISHDITPHIANIISKEINKMPIVFFYLVFIRCPFFVIFNMFYNNMLLPNNLFIMQIYVFSFILLKSVVSMGRWRFDRSSFLMGYFSHPVWEK